MFRRSKPFACLMVLLALVLTLLTPALANDDPVIAAWAQEEAALALEEELVPAFSGDWDVNISAVQAASIVVSLINRVLDGTVTDYDAGPFSDSYGDNMVARFTEAGLSGDMDETDFLRQKFLSREAYISMLYRGMQYIESALALEVLPILKIEPLYTDWDQVSPEAREGVSAFLAAGIVWGTSAKTLTPAYPIHRDEAVVMLYRCFALLESHLAYTA